MHRAFATQARASCLDCADAKSSNMKKRRSISVASLIGLVAFAIGICWLIWASARRVVEPMALPDATPRVAMSDDPNGADASVPSASPNRTRQEKITGRQGVSTAQASLTLANLASGPKAAIADGHAGSSSCRECHAEAHQSWSTSFHRTMTQEVNQETAPDAIKNKTVTVQGKAYVFEESGANLYVTFPDPLVGNQLRRRQLVLMTGSHHMHVFWYASDVNGTPGQLDIVFLIHEERWIPRESSFLRPGGHSPVIELGTWNRTCSRCHATHPREGFNEETEDWSTKVTEFGIACEACHGEGAGHVARHSAKELSLPDAIVAGTASPHVDDHTLVSDSIVNPSKLSKQASADVCGQCHSIFIPNYEALSQSDYMRVGSPFRPGELLSDDGFIQVVRAVPDQRNSEAFTRWSAMEELSSGFWSDGTPRIAGREYNGLIESPCFQKGEMTCLSCHTMHPSKDQDLASWRDDQLKPGMRGDQACLQCHQEYKDRIEEHTHHSVQSDGSRCMNCHMPHTTYGLLKTIRSHQISSPSIAASQTSDRPDACSLCHLDKTFHWVGEHLSNWYGQPFDKETHSSRPAGVSTSVLHFLSGDAAQRAVQVAAMGWAPAQVASGTDWIEPYLLLGLNDPYDAIRLVAARSLKTLPNRIATDIDPLAPTNERMQAFNDSINLIEKNLRPKPRSSVLVDEQGRFSFPTLRNYLDRRNHRPIYLRE